LASLGVRTLVTRKLRRMLRRVLRREVASSDSVSVCVKRFGIVLSARFITTTKEGEGVVTWPQ